jgi:hypothetical protein
MKDNKKKSLREERKGEAITKRLIMTGRKLAEQKELSRIVKSISYPTVNRSLIRRNTRLSARLRKVLAAASPESSVNLISGIAVDLADFWEIGDEHRRRIKQLLNMQFPKDKKRFENMLYDFEIRLVIHAEWHAKHLKKFLAAYKKDFTQ